MSELLAEVKKRLILSALPVLKDEHKIVNELLEKLSDLGVDEPQDLKYIPPEKLIPPLKFVQACKLIEEGKKELKPTETTDELIEARDEHTRSENNDETEETISNLESSDNTSFSSCGPKISINARKIGEAKSALHDYNENHYEKITYDQRKTKGDAVKQKKSETINWNMSGNSSIHARNMQTAGDMTVTEYNYGSDSKKNNRQIDEPIAKRTKTKK